MEDKASPSKRGAGEPLPGWWSLHSASISLDCRASFSHHFYAPRVVPNVPMANQPSCYQLIRTTTYTAYTAYTYYY